jgi:hypothetical protein
MRGVPLFLPPPRPRPHARMHASRLAHAAPHQRTSVRAPCARRPAPHARAHGCAHTYTQARKPAAAGTLHLSTKLARTAAWSCTPAGIHGTRARTLHTTARTTCMCAHSFARPHGEQDPTHVRMAAHASTSARLHTRTRVHAQVTSPGAPARLH